MKWIIDRLEAGMAVVTYKDFSFNIPCECLPADTTEGTALCVTAENSGEESEKARRLMDDIFGKSK